MRVWRSRRAGEANNNWRCGPFVGAINAHAQSDATTRARHAFCNPPMCVHPPPCELQVRVARASCTRRRTSRNGSGSARANRDLETGGIPLLPAPPPRPLPRPSPPLPPSFIHPPPHPYPPHPGRQNGSSSPPSSPACPRRGRRRPLPPPRTAWVHPPPPPPGPSAPTGCSCGPGLNPPWSGGRPRWCGWRATTRSSCRGSRGR